LKQYELTGGNVFDMVFMSSFHKPFYSHGTIAKQFKIYLMTETNDISINYVIPLHL